MIGACPLTSRAPPDATQTAQRAFSTDPPNRPPCPVTLESDTLRLYGQQRRRCAFLAGPAQPWDQHATSCVHRTAQRVPASSGRAPVSCRAACRAARRAGDHCRWRGLRCAVPVVPAHPQDHHGTYCIDRTARRIRRAHERYLPPGIDQYVAVNCRLSQRPKKEIDVAASGRSAAGRWPREAGAEKPWRGLSHTTRISTGSCSN